MFEQRYAIILQSLHAPYLAPDVSPIDLEDKSLKSLASNGDSWAVLCTGGSSANHVSFNDERVLYLFFAPRSHFIFTVWNFGQALEKFARGSFASFSCQPCVSDAEQIDGKRSHHRYRLFQVSPQLPRGRCPKRFPSLSRQMQRRNF